MQLCSAATAFTQQLGVENTEQLCSVSAHLEGQANGIKCIDSTANDSRYLSRCSIIMAVRGDIQKTMDVPFSRPSQRWVPYLPVVSDGNLGSQYLRAKWVPLQNTLPYLSVKVFNNYTATTVEPLYELRTCL